jgi:predicted Zn-dependent protease
MLAVALVAGCAAVADVVLPPEQAAQLGAQMAQNIEAQQGLHPDAAMQARVDRIGRRVLRAAPDMPDAYDFSFDVLQAPDTLNAFALPGGKIYATSALVELAGSDAELASVLAHEIAHVAERHIADRLAAQYGVQALAAAALGQNPGLVAGLAGSVLQQGLLMKYSREQELQADRRGLAYLRAAGYDPQAAVAMFRKLGAAREGGDGGLARFFASHPGTEERIDQLQDIIARR